MAASQSRRANPNLEPSRRRTANKKAPPELLRLWQDFPFLIQKVNVLRMVILEAHGGIYLDLDMECLRSFDPYFGLDIFFARHGIVPVCNAILGAQIGHPFRETTFLEIQKHPARIHVSSDGIKTTGAALLSKLVEEEYVDKCESAWYSFRRRDISTKLFDSPQRGPSLDW